MDTRVSLTELAATELAKAIDSSSGRSAITVWGGRDRQLRHTLMALRAGEALAEHSSPGEATLQVLLGRVTLQSGEQSWAAAAGDFLPLPDAVHSLDAVENSVILLTVVKAH